MEKTRLPDKRLNAHRDDLANVELKSIVPSPKYVQGRPARICSHFADVMDRPDPSAGLQTQILHGHDISVFDSRDGWAWIQGQNDGYVGYVRQSDITMAPDAGFEPATHMVLAPRTFLYSESDMKMPRTGYRSMGSKLRITERQTTRGTDYAILDSGGAVIAQHLIPVGTWMKDPVSVAETLLHTPYLWGGNTAFGIDCSGLVSLANLLCGRSVLRDSDMQANTIGDEVPMELDKLRRGDLVFWKGHVGMMADAMTLLHANGHSMNVALEPLAEAVERIGYLYGQPTNIRRP